NMGKICDLYDGWEYYVTRAELAYHENNFSNALNQAQLAQKYAKTKARQSAIGIFIAKCYTALGDFEKSSQTYRDLIKDGTYLPPVMMGLMYNHLEEKKNIKVKNNITVVKLFTNNEETNGSI
ncbi:MAG: hypothetical protein MJ054_02210, partial [Clostridia bacterium]|nr:hypothetical protein [Clostridia bacterium]